MTATSGSLRRRLVFALVGLSVGSVLLAGLITVVAARPATRSAAISELRRGLAALAEEVRGVERPRLVVAQLKDRLLANQVAVVTVLPNGTIGRRGNLTNGVRAADLDGPSLAGGNVASGGRGQVVWVAQPLGTGRDGTLVLVATRRIGVFAVGRLGGILILAAVVAAAVAVAVSLWLVRRLTRPLQAMEQTARAIAAGNLDARVALPDADDELAAVGRAIDTMAAELSRHRSLERAFLMSISHDLRTPLTSIRGYGEAIAEGAADDEPLMDDAARRRAGSIIVAEARRLERLVADLLELARLDAREFSLHMGPVDVAEVARHSTLALEPAAREAGVELTVTGEAGPVMAQADAERLGQVVANLVENALKYAARTVEVTTRAAGGGAELSVADDGAGIDPADLPRVFERLYTSRRQPGRKVGTGLGLAIVRELVTAMGGRVDVGPTAGGGTRFVVTLPSVPSTSGGGSTSWRTTADGSSSSTTTSSPSASSSSSSPPAGGSSS